MNKSMRIIVVVAFAVAGLYMLNALFTRPRAEQLPLPYSQFIREVKAGTVRQVMFEGPAIKGETKDGEPFIVYSVEDPHLVNDLLNSDVIIKSAPPPTRNFFVEVLVNWFPFLLLIGVWIYFTRKQTGAGPGMMGKSKHKLLADSGPKVFFDDVAGCDEAKHDIAEVVDFLKDPFRFSKLGGKIPRGVLLVGPPGTGKTMLAKAVANEAGVQFFSISGSDFVEMFVGVGASRVRDMFAEARKQSPCIIFIDEIDAIGKARTGSMVGNDERDQTLNALLVEMDGFDVGEGIIIVAATNRPEILDNALLRPGRFDRQVTVGLPDITGREQILAVHTRDIPMGEDVSLHDLARGTPGFSGAELANLVNEASILASRNDSDWVSMADFEKAKDKLLMGAERRTFAMSQEEKLLTAYHEVGHLLVGYFSPQHDPVYKVSIIPRGRALGITMFLPERDNVSMSKAKIESQIASLYGGRIAEEIVAGKDGITTGASNDIERATLLATKMVTEWGMSDNLKPLKYIEESQGFAGASHNTPHGSDHLNDTITAEIDAIIDRNYGRATDIIRSNWDKMEKLVKLIMKHETIDIKQIEKVLGKKAKPKSLA